MAPEKSHHFLDAEESEDDGSQGYNSEAEELQKGGGGRSAKRRRIHDDSEEEGDSDWGHLSAPELDTLETQPRKKEQEADSEDDREFEDAEDAEDKEGDDDEDDDDHETKKATKRKAADLPSPASQKPLLFSKKNLVATDAAIKKSGVVYLSRIPPFMKPAKLRSLLAPHGTINRVFLAPEDPAAHARRVRAGGNKKRSFTEGWVEFVRKADAKQACELLNARPIGGKKGSYYRDDVWSLLYLRGFKWNNLTEQIAAENAERGSRMRAELSRTIKENNEFVRNVEKAKKIEGIQGRLAAKRKRDGKEGGEDPGQAAAGAASGGSRSSAAPGRENAIAFKQRQNAKKGDAANQLEQVQRVLSKIF